MLLEIRDLWVHYGRAEALKGISISVEEGSIVTLLGANGAGKTTTLRTISGLKRPTSGEIWYQSKRIDSLPPHEIVKRGIAQVPEGRQLFYSLSVYENLQMGAFLCKGRGEFKKNLDLMCEHFPALKNRIKNRQQT
jgi:branched-chain amino acid transport system ATP-binding protein